MRVSWGKLGVAGATGAIQLFLADQDAKATPAPRTEPFKKWEDWEGLFLGGGGILAGMFAPDFQPDLVEAATLSQIPNLERALYNWVRKLTAPAGTIPQYLQRVQARALPAGRPVAPVPAGRPVGRSYLPEVVQTLTY